jgi:hypothetical protein
MDDDTYNFKAELWAWKGDAAWHFLTLPKELSARIKFFSAQPKRGFGSVRVEVCIGASVWKTSIFPSKTSKAYILPVKAAVRQAEKLVAGRSAKVRLRIVG